MEKIKICLDVDGVLLNFMQTIGNFIKNEYKINPAFHYSTAQYDLYERFDKEKIDSIGFNNIKLSFEQAGYWSFLEPMPEIELIHDLIKNPLFEISFLTSIPVHLHNQRLHNLSSILGINLSSEQLFCVPLGESKKPYFDKIKPHFFIEDNLHNIKDCNNNEHTSFWINHKENYYDESCIPHLKVIEVNHLNHAIEEIKKSLINQNIEQIINKIHTVLDDSLLTSQYKKINRKSKTEGHCYASAEALYHILGGKLNGLIPQVATFEENGLKMSHWWLKDKNGNIIDPTAEQFYSVNSTPPYHLGKGAGFLTKHPSKRARTIIERIVNKNDYQIKSKMIF